MRIWLSVIFILSIVTTSGAEEPVAKRRALLVGINTYSVEPLKERPVRYAVSDMQQLAEVLKTAGWEVTLLTSNGTADSAKRANIVAALDKLLDGAGVNDLVLVALSGHGRQFRARIDRSEGAAEQEEVFFCPSDAKEKNPDTLLGITELTQRLGKSSATKLVMIDAARIAPVGMPPPKDDDFRLSLPPNTAIFFGSASGQPALETNLMYGRDSAKGHGIFLHRVLLALQGDAQNDRGQVTWSSVVEYVAERVNDDAVRWYPEHARKLPNGEMIVQTPHLVGSFAGRSPVLLGLKAR